ncbi:MAG: PAS domain-containing protein [candidate division Zixibacteria bacterium]|nr:PAS domain-containing protein [candidate division Zixibacteria bacterium]
MRPRRLFWQVYPWILAVIILSLVLVSWWSSSRMRAFYLAETSEKLRARALLVEYHLAKTGWTANTQELTEMCRQMVAQTQARITIIDRNGTVLGDSHEDHATMEPHDTRPEISEAMRGTVGVSTRYSNTLQNTLMYVAVPVRIDNEIRGVVRTALPLTAIDSTLRSLNVKIALAGVVVLILATLITLGLFRRIRRPLDELRKGADRFAQGKFDLRVAVPETEEIHALAQAMNRMAEQLDERIKTIVRQRKEQEAILSAMIEGVIAIDMTECVINCNRAAAILLGFDEHRAAGRSIQELIRNAALHDFVSATLRSVTATETGIALNDANETYLQVHGTHLRDVSGEVIGVVIVLNDLTRIKRLENVRREFVANVSHELKTPITSIVGFVETLLDGAIEDPDDTRRFLAIINKQANRLGAIVEDLLTLSRLENDAEHDRLELRRGSVRAVLTAAVQACSSAAAARNITLETDCPGDLEVPMNSLRLEQAVVNLIDNAIKYSDEGSSVWIEAGRDDERLYIAVRDRGIGIDRKHHPRLFERFYRVDRARSREHGGTGLGLAIVKHIMLAHRGSVEVESAVDQGSTFRLTIPVSPA